MPINKQINDYVFIAIQLVGAGFSLFVFSVHGLKISDFYFFIDFVSCGIVMNRQRLPVLLVKGDRLVDWQKQKASSNP